ncbi:MAG TPA: hypothetical protein VIL72_12900, partial [Beijerinckiaceae bacterium]
FFFLFNQGLLFQGEWIDIARDTALGAIVVLASVLVVMGHVRRRTAPAIVRVAFAALVVGMIVPWGALQAGCAAASLALYAAMYRQARGREVREAPPLAATPAG